MASKSTIPVQLSSGDGSTATDIYHLLIPNKTGNHVLASKLSQDLLALPTAVLPEEFEFERGNREATMESRIGDQLGFYVHIARELCDFGNHYLLAANVWDEGPTHSQRYEWIPQHSALKSEWKPMSDLNRSPDIRSEVENMLMEMNDDGPWNEFEPWLNVRWFYNMSSWLTGVLKERNATVEGPARQVSRNSLSLVMKCDVQFRSGGESQQTTSSEAIFIKTSNPVIHEGKRTVAIRRVIGRIVPEVIAVHEGYGTMIQKDAGSITDEPLSQEALVNTVFKMQRISMHRIDELEAGGLNVVDSEWLGCNIESILNHRAFDDDWWPEDEIAREAIKNARTRVGSMQEAFRKVASLKLRNTLVHGDMLFHNVGSRKNGGGEQYCLFDWAESFVGEPLWDFIKLLTFHEYPSFPGYTINCESGTALFSKYWMPSATRDEVEMMLIAVQMVFHATQVYLVTKQYDDSISSEYFALKGPLEDALLDLLEMDARYAISRKRMNSN